MRQGEDIYEGKESEGKSRANIKDETDEYKSEKWNALKLMMVRETEIHGERNKNKKEGNQSGKGGRTRKWETSEKEDRKMKWPENKASVNGRRKRIASVGMRKEGAV